MTIDKVRADINGLIANLSTRENKYRRNFNRYCNNGRRTEDIHNPYGNPLAYQLFGEDTTGIIPAINLCKSAIDTYISKLSQTKVRPFFNSVNGTFKTRKVCRNAQIYFDEFYNEKNIYAKAIEAARDAAIFEVGYLWVREDTKDVIKLRPWEYYFDRAEWQNGKLSRCLIKIEKYPLVYYKEQLKKFYDLKQKLEDNSSSKVQFKVYYDLVDKQKYIFLDDTLISQEKISYDIPPVVAIYHSPPIKGAYSTSMIDDVYSIQTEVDMLTHRIHTAAVLNPANTIFIPDGIDIKASNISNEVGNIYTYKAAGQNPISVSTPAPISPQYIDLLRYYEEKAYNILGISQLSAQSKKPSGIESGVALETLEDVESERHNTMLQNYITFLMNIAKTCIEIYDEKEKILPNKIGTASITWGEVKKERDKYSIQFGAASALSKDPKVKMEQIEKMKSMGLIKDDAILTSLMDIPDLERAYSMETASLDACERIIERAVENDVYDFYQTVDLTKLLQLTAYYINRLDANDEDIDIIDRLKKLLDVVTVNIENIEMANAPEEPMPEQPPVEEPVVEQAPVA